MISSVNLALFSAYRLHQKWAVGFNIDLIGLSFGPRRESSDFSNGFDGAPTRFNVFKGAENDVGTLNSEVWIGYFLNPNLVLKSGIAHFVGEYETTQSQSGGNNRFRRFNNLLILGIKVRVR
jgi:long-subunit fatty acid transport protein